MPLIQTEITLLLTDPLGVHGNIVPNTPQAQPDNT